MRLDICFNPYSNGSYSGRGQRGILAISTRHVSILILMEVTLEVDSLYHVPLYVLCFNPYSNGSYSGRFFMVVVIQKAFFVSILILMEVTLEEQEMTHWYLSQ